MEYLLLLILVVCWLIVRARDRARRQRFEAVFLERIDGLDGRLRQLETQHARIAAAARLEPIAASPTEAPLPSVLPAVEEQPVSQSQSPPPSQVLEEYAMPVFASHEDRASAPAPELAPPAHRAVSLEERLGANWLNKLGIVILVFGVAFFLAYQLKNLGPLGKTMVGFAVSAALLVGGLLLERRPKYRLFARAGIGGGWALTFFLAYAVYHVSATKVLTSQAIDLLLMLLVAAGMVWHSLRYHSQVVTGLAFLLAFSTVTISQVTAFSLLANAVLAAGLVYVTSREHWAELELAGLVAVYCNHFLWLYHILPAHGGAAYSFPQFFPSAGLILLYWLIFRIPYIRGTPLTKREDLLTSATALLNSAGVLGLLKYQSAHPEWAFWALLAIGGTEMTLAFLVRRRRRTAFIVLSTIASGLLLAAIPFRYQGADWSLLWLLQAEILFLAGLRLRELVFRLLGTAAGLAAGCQLAIVDVLPILTLRATHPDRAVHWLAGIALAAAALLYWFNSLLAPRRWQQIGVSEVESEARTLTSYFALLAAAASLWVWIPENGTVIVWMALALGLGLAADWLDSGNLALQTDLLVSASILRVLVINLAGTADWGWLTQRAVSVGLVSAMCYAGTRRSKGFGRFAGSYIAPAYSWAGSLLLALLLWYELKPIGVAVGWVVMALVLLEVGTLRDHTYLRRQACLLLAASFARMFFVNMNSGHTARLFSPRLYTVLPLIAAYYWIYERLRNQKRDVLFARVASAIACCCATVAAAALIYFEVRAAWVVIAWAVLAFSLLLSARILGRRLFLIQALLLVVVVFFRGLAYNLTAPAYPGWKLWEGPAACIGISVAILFAMLPIAFQLRNRDRVMDRSTDGMQWLQLVIDRPEQFLFFVPLLLLTIMLAHEMRSGMITVAWSALGVSVFLLALLVGERSYRLAGLGLLLLGVGKILFIDVWKLTAIDRYVTLMVMGIALLLVSFLYTRYREVILRLL